MQHQCCRSADQVCGEVLGVWAPHEKKSESSTSKTYLKMCTIYAIYIYNSLHTYNIHNAGTSTLKAIWKFEHDWDELLHLGSGRDRSQCGALYLSETQQSYGLKLSSYHGLLSQTCRVCWISFDAAWRCSWKHMETLHLISQSWFSNQQMPPALGSLQQ